MSTRATISIGIKAIANRVICRDAQGCKLPFAAKYSIAKPMPDIAAIRMMRPHWMPRSLSAKLSRRWPMSADRLVIGSAATRVGAHGGRLGWRCGRVLGDGRLRHAPGGIALLGFGQHVAADRRGKGGAAAAAFAAMLHHDGADITRRVDRCEGDEQRVVAFFPRNRGALANAVLALSRADPPDLRGARFPAHRHRRVGDARPIGRAALFVDDGVHAVEHEGEPARVDAEFGKGWGSNVAAGGKAALRPEQAWHHRPAGHKPRR